MQWVFGKPTDFDDQQSTILFADSNYCYPQSYSGKSLGHLLSVATHAKSQNLVLYNPFNGFEATTEELVPAPWRVVWV